MLNSSLNPSLNPSWTSLRSRGSARLLLLTVLTFLSACSEAKEPAPRSAAAPAAAEKTSSLCDPQSSSTLAINACSEEESDAAEAKLNQAYKRVMSLLAAPDTGIAAPAEVRKHLVAAQRAWIAFRQSDCLARDVASGNATLRTEYSSCMTAHAQARTAELLKYTEY